MINNLVFEKEKISAINNAIYNICFSCQGLDILCDRCEVNQAKINIISLPLINNEQIEIKNLQVIYDNANEEDLEIGDITFDKNKVMLAQNAIEDLCSNCLGIGTLCFDCKIHELRRNLASLPLIDSVRTFDTTEKKSSAKSCGTSCSTGCKPKKK